MNFVECSVTRWLDYLSLFGHLLQNKFAQKHADFANVGSKFGRILDKLAETMPNAF